MVLYILWVCLIILLIGLAILIGDFRLYKLLIGYNKISKQERENIDIEMVSRQYVRLFFSIAIILIIVLTLQYQGIVWGVYLLLSIPVIVPIFLMSTIKYDNNEVKVFNYKAFYTYFICLILVILIGIAGMLML